MKTLVPVKRVVDYNVKISVKTDGTKSIVVEVLPGVRDIGWQAHVRLCVRNRRLSALGKNANLVTIAIAREMVGFVWSSACTVQSAPKAP